MEEKGSVWKIGGQGRRKRGRRSVFKAKLKIEINGLLMGIGNRDFGMCNFRGLRDFRGFYSGFVGLMGRTTGFNGTFNVKNRLAS